MTERADSALVPAPDLVIVLTTMPSREAALTLARTLVMERLAACVKTLPGLASTYVWQGKLTVQEEVLCLIKTQRGRLGTFIPRLQQLHPYDVPEVLVVSTEAASQAYLAWALAATGPADHEAPLQSPR